VDKVRAGNAMTSESQLTSAGLSDVPSAPLQSTEEPIQVTVSEPPKAYRILVVDDNPSIHEDFRKILAGDTQAHSLLKAAENALFGDRTKPVERPGFKLDFAQQGQEALEKVIVAVTERQPYALAFVDMRMPPGWDGIETIKRIWEVYAELQIVICTAYSDYSWDETVAQLGSPDNLVILRKPFDNVEVLQLAHSFTRKWELNQQARLKCEELAEMVARRTCELEKANNELRREIEERVQAERQLRQAQKMEAIGQLAAGVAHDFNNILTVVHGHASMLSMRLGETGPHAKSILEIRHSAERAANLVRQLLMFSRKQVMQFRNVDLAEVMRSVSGMLRQLIGEHIFLETHCAPGLMLVTADRGMIEQVIVNLTINARDAMARGGRIAITATNKTLDAQAAKRNHEARPGAFVCLKVLDTGSGIDPSALAHIFEPFFTTKEVGAGSGLGLATVYGIIKQHQGWIEVDSQLGKGTQFKIYIPAIAVAHPHPPEKTPDAQPNRPAAETILVAEDEPSLRDIVSDVLTLQGYRVLAAGSGPEALEIWEREQSAIDLLLTDMVMPGGMMGTDLAAELQRTNPTLKVIYTTGYSPGSTGLQNVLNQGVEFLPKPYAPSKLVEAVRRCLDATNA